MGNWSESALLRVADRSSDARIVKAPIQRNTHEENAQIKKGEMVMQWSDAQRAQKVAQACWTSKDCKNWYGYTLHISADRRLGLIRRHSVSTAHVHDSQHLEALLDPSNTGRSVWADSAYAKRERSAKADLEQKSYRACIVHKAKRGKLLRSAMQRRSRRLSRERASVEHVLARLAHYGGKYVRCIGLERANVVIGLKVVIENLMCLARLHQRAIVSV